VILISFDNGDFWPGGLVSFFLCLGNIEFTNGFLPYVLFSQYLAVCLVSDRSCAGIVFAHTWRIPKRLTGDDRAR